MSARPSWIDWKSFSTISRVSVSLFTTQGISRSFLSVFTNASCALLLARTLDLLRYLMFFQAALMLLRVIALYSVYLFVWQKAKICRGTSVRARTFSGGFLHPSNTSRNLCLTVARTNLRKYRCCLQFLSL